MTRKYCKAYYLKDLRLFADWADNSKAEAAQLNDDDVVYLWDDFTVVKSPVIPEDGLLFDAVTPAWQEFCKISLQFEIPEDLRYAYEPAEDQSGEEVAQS